MGSAKVQNSIFDPRWISRHTRSSKILNISVDDVRDAAFPEGGNGEGRIKERVIMYELISYGNIEIRISALGGHGFSIYSSPGHRLVPILSSGRHQITPLYHETAAVKAIKTANQLSSMDRAGGINFHPINWVDIA